MLVRLTRGNVISGGAHIGNDLDNPEKFVLLSISKEGKVGIEVLSNVVAYELRQALGTFLKDIKSLK